LKREKEGYAAIRDELSSDRYYALLDALDTLVSRPRLGKAAAEPAGTRLRDVAAANWNRVVKAYGRARSIEDPDARDIAMHDVRKAAKRARYTAEALRGPLGKRMGELAALAENVQEALGTYRDGVVAQETLVEEARAAREAGEDTFTHGVLAGLEHAAAERAHAEFPRVWAATAARVEKVLSLATPRRPHPPAGPVQHHEPALGRVRLPAAERGDQARQHRAVTAHHRRPGQRADQL